MVKVKDFYGAVFHPEEYQTILHNNIEHLESVPMSKTFNTAEMIASGRLQPETAPFFYVYRQHYLTHTSYGVLAEISLQVPFHSPRITIITKSRSTKKPCTGRDSTTRPTCRTTWGRWWSATARTSRSTR